MNMKSFSDIVKLHQEFSAMLTEQEKDLRERRKGTIDEMLPEMRAALKQAKAELDAVHRAKTEAVQGGRLLSAGLRLLLGREDGSACRR